MIAALAVTALTGCSVTSAGAAEDRSYDAIERIRATRGGAADTSYEAVEKSRLSIFPAAPGGGR